MTAPPTRAVAIGGSAGAFRASCTILGELPGRVPWPILLVLHQLPNRPSLVPELLRSSCQLPVSAGADKEPIEAGTIYVAPPDYHLLVEHDHSLALSQDAPENFSRPSIDALFETAAEAYRGGLLAVLLSGANRDGARGLRAVRALGGRIVVQDPATADCERMPREGLAAVEPDAVLSPEQIGRYLATLAREAD